VEGAGWPLGGYSGKKKKKKEVIGKRNIYRRERQKISRIGAAERGIRYVTSSSGGVEGEKGKVRN